MSQNISNLAMKQYGCMFDVLFFFFVDCWICATWLIAFFPPRPPVLPPYPTFSSIWLFLMHSLLFWHISFIFFNCCHSKLFPWLPKSPFSSLSLSLQSLTLQRTRSRLHRHTDCPSAVSASTHLFPSATFTQTLSSPVNVILQSANGETVGGSHHCTHANIQ